LGTTARLPGCHGIWRSAEEGPPLKALRLEREGLGLSAEREEPGLSAECEEPGLSVEREEPGLFAGGEEPGLSVKGEEPDLSSEGEETGLSVEGEEPGLPTGEVLAARAESPASGSGLLENSVLADMERPAAQLEVMDEVVPEDVVGVEEGADEKPFNGFTDNDVKKALENRVSAELAGRCASGPVTAKSEKVVRKVQPSLVGKAQPSLAMKAQPSQVRKVQPSTAMKAQPSPSREAQPRARDAAPQWAGRPSTPRRPPRPLPAPHSPDSLVGGRSTASEVLRARGRSKVIRQKLAPAGRLRFLVNERLMEMGFIDDVVAGERLVVDRPHKDFTYTALRCTASSHIK
jgi:hypothetical protein